MPFLTANGLIRHPRHRTGVHTDAVTTSSGPLDPLTTAIFTPEMQSLDLT